MNRMLELYPFRKPHELDARVANGGYVFEVKKEGWLWSSETGLYVACDPGRLSLFLQFGKGDAKLNETLLFSPKSVERDVRMDNARLLEDVVGVSPIALAEARIRCPRAYLPKAHREGVKQVLRDAVVQLFPLCYAFELEARAYARKNSA